jgi:glycosidase
MYKYVVNGSDWKTDPNNPNTADDGMGGQNSVITVTAAAPATSAAPATPAAPAAAPRAGTRFLYLGDANTRSVAVAGSFNNWSTSSHRLTNPKGDGVWIGEFPIPSGVYEYKFVINATEWKADPNNPKKKDDGMGGENSILEVSMSLPPGSGVSPPIGARDRPAAAAAASARVMDLWAVEPLHRFAYRPSAGVTSVAVAGSFNNWSTTAHPLTDADGDGLWTLELKLPDGRSSYKYVENGTKWIPDPANPLSEPDGVGGKNSIIVHGGEDAVSGEARRGDGKIEAAAIRHRPDARFVTRASETLLIVTLRVARNDIEGVDLIVNGQDAHHLELLTHDRNHEYWRGSAAISRESVSYHFILKDGAGRLPLSRNGLAREGEGRAFEIGPGPAFITPDWARAAILYQVFPDRFANGNPENDPKGPDLRPWKHELLPKNSTGWNARYGGDIEGLLARSDYLTELGVTGLKLNPILTAPSAAKYDVTDYENVDPEFGGTEAFEALLKRRDFHIVVDGVFNHSGEKHPFFRDAVARGPASPKYAWYNFLKWPLPDRLEGSGPNAPSNYYECWWGFGGLPAWNTRNPEVREYLMGSAEKWTRAGVDGWRLDAANEVEHEFWIEFRERMRRINPEAWIAGEIWEIALEWLLGDQFDAVTNYPLRGAILDFFVEEKIDAGQFADRIAALTVAVPPQVLSVQYNHLSSHDVPRIMTIARGDAAKAMQAATFQFARPGVPVIYYGDEIGMEGGEDPDNRRVFPWDERELWNESMHRRYRELIGLRRRVSTLSASAWRPLHAKGRLLIVATKDASGTLVMAFNASGSASEPIEIRLPADLAAGAADFTEILSGGALESGEIVMTIPAIEARGSRFYFSAKSE